MSNLVKFSLLGIIIILLYIIFLNSRHVNFMRYYYETPTPDRPTLRSLFDDDLCLPPCWFGLTPGLTSPEDIEKILYSLEQVGNIRISPDSLINPSQGFVEDGFYDFDFVIDKWDGISSYIRIDNGNLNLISVSLGKNISLGETLINLSHPTSIRVTNIFNISIMLLFYDNYNLVVVLYTGVNECYIYDIENSFFVQNLYYYAEDFRDTLIRSQLFTESDFVELTSVTLETWLLNDDSVTCNEAINALFELRDQTED